MPNASDVTVVYDAQDSTEAQLVLIALEAAGIHAVVDGNFEALAGVPIGGSFTARILVPKDSVGRAKQVILKLSKKHSR